MKTMYISHALTLEEAQAAQMLAESLKLSDTTVDGSQALTKEDEDWEIWDED